MLQALSVTIKNYFSKKCACGVFGFALWLYVARHTLCVLRSRIKNIVLLFSLPFLFFALAPAFVYAAPGVPNLLHYQGRLLDANGNLLGGTGTNYCFRFSFYDDATVGAPDNRLWPAAAPSNMTVNVRNGVFTAAIGDTGAGGDTLDFNFKDTDDVYVNVEVATLVGPDCSGGDEVFENMNPRQRILSSGYAINAGTVFGAGQSAIGTTTPFQDAVLTIEATSTSAIPLVIRKFLDQVSDIFRIVTETGRALLTMAANGFLGIGTSTPSALLSVHGDALLGNLTATGTITAQGLGISSFAGGLGIGTTSPTEFFSTHGNFYTSGTAFIGSTLTATSSAFFALDGGSVGIGTTTPTEQLSVANRLYVGGIGTSTIEDNLHVQGTLQVGTSSLFISNNTIKSSGAIQLDPGTGSTVNLGTTTITNLSVTNATLSTFAGTIQAELINTASTTATSTFANGIELSGGCFRDISGQCLQRSNPVLASFRESAGGGNINAVTATSVPFNIEDRKDSGITHPVAGDNSRIQFDEAGSYWVSYSINGTNTSGGVARTNVQCGIRMNGGASFTNPSVSYSYSRSTDDNELTNNATFLLETSSANEYGQIFCLGIGVTTPTVNLIANESWISIEKIGGTLGGGGGGGSISGSGNSDQITFWTGTQTISGDPQFVWTATDRLGIATSAPFTTLSVGGQAAADYFTSTSQTASTFAGVINVTDSAATSSFANGVRLTSGCFELPDGSCAGSSAVTTNIGSANRLSYYSATNVIDSVNFLAVDATNGRLGIGATSPEAMLHLYDTDDSDFIIEAATSTANASTLYIRKSRSDGPISSGDTIGALTFAADDALDFNDAASIVAVSEGTIGVGKTPSSLRFSTDDLNGSFAERMRITPDGYVGIGTTSPGLPFSVSRNALFGGDITTQSIIATSTLTVQGSGTSTFAGGTSLAGLLSTNGLEVSGGNILLPASSIQNTELENSSVSYGGVSLSLGQSDASPAFDLTDAINLPIDAGTSGTLPINRGGTNAVGLSPSTILEFDGTRIIGTSTISVASIIATSSATSTFAGGLDTNILNITSQIATSTFANGIRLGAGCFLLPDGSCAGQDAATLSGVTSSQFLRSDASDAYTSGTLTLNSGTILDINGDIAIADTTIVFDGASTDIAATGNLSFNTDDVVVEKSTGNIGIASTSPSALLGVQGAGLFAGDVTLPSLTATGTLAVRGSATSTFAGGIQANLLNITSASATSTFANGIRLSGGCFQLTDGTCAGSDPVTTNLGTQNRIAYYSNSNSVNSADFLALDTANERLGIGTSSPYAALSVGGAVVMDSFNATSTSATSQIAGNLSVDGTFVSGAATLSTLSVTNTTATSTISGNFEISGNASTSNFVASNSFYGAGLTNCTASTSRIHWDVTTGKFVCDEDQAVAFDVYDNAGGQIISFAASTTINLDTVRTNTASDVFSLSGDTLTVNATGTYAFDFRVTTRVNADDRTWTRVWLERNTGAGFTEVDGSYGSIYNRTNLDNNAGETTASVKVTIAANGGDQFRIRAVSQDNDVITVADASSLSVEQLSGPGSQNQDLNGSGSFGQVSFWSAGTALSGDANLYWDNTAKRLGVGTSSPEYLVDVNGVLRTSQESIFDAGLRLPGLTNCNSTQALATDASGAIICDFDESGGGGGGGGSGNWIFNAANGGYLRLATTSNIVGVGTTSPYAKLSLTSGDTATTTVALSAVSGQTANIIDIYDTSQNLNTVLTAAHNFGIGTTSPTEQLSVANRLYVGGAGTSTIENNLNVREALDIGSGMLHLTGNTIRGSGVVQLAPASGSNLDVSLFTTGNFTVNSDDFVVDTSSGFVGVGTTTPGARFAVHGAGLFASDVTLPNLTATGTLTVQGAGTSTYIGGIQANLLNITSASATSTFANGIRLSGGTVRAENLISCDTIDTDAQGNFICGSDSGASGSITSLNGLTNSVQTFSDIDDTNVTLTITSASGDHEFALGWAGALASSRGGLGGDFSTSDGWLHVDAGTVTASTSPNVERIIATSTTIASEFRGGVAITCTDCITNTNVADNLTIANTGSVDSTALIDGGTIGFDWIDDEVADVLTIAAGSSVDSTALTDGGTISFDWTDDEVADVLTISGGTIENTPIGAVTPSTAIFSHATSTGTLNVDGLATLSYASSTAFSAINSIFIGGTGTTTIVGDSGTSVFSGTVQADLLNITSVSATSSFANGIRLTGGCFELPDGSCAGAGGAVTTNTGTPNRLSYYSSASTVDSANFLTVDATNERFGIGETNPLGALHIYSLNNSDLYLESASTTANASTLAFRKSRNGSPILTGDAIGSFTFSAYEGLDFNQAAGIDIVTEGTIGVGQTPASIRFSTDNTSGIFAERARITPDGYVGIGTTSPVVMLSVAGGGLFGGDVTAQGFIATSTLTVQGTGTSTFSGGISAAGLATSQGLTISGGSLLSFGPGTLSSLSLTDTAATSTISGNLEISGNASTSKLVVSNSFSGAGLTNCTGSSSKLIWDGATGQFGCGTDSGIANTFDAYDNVGGQSITATPITVNIDTIRKNHSNYTLAADEITVNSSGMYTVTYRCSAENSNTNRDTTRCFLETNTGAGFTEVDGSSCFAYNRINANEGTQSCGGTVVLNLSATDDIRLRAVEFGVGGALTTLADGSGITIEKFNESGADLAEVYYTDDETLGAGYMVSADPVSSTGVIKSSSENRAVLGIISTKPGLVIGENINGIERRPVLVALSGRVPVKISTENGDIRSGDFITFSSVSGVGMKATAPGRVVGMALEPYTAADAALDEENGAVGQIMVFVNPHWYGGEWERAFAVKTASSTVSSGENTDGFFSRMQEIVRSTFESFGIALKDGVAKFQNIFARTVTAEKAIIAEAEIENARVENLEVQNSMQIADRATGETYCVWLENGEWRKELGVCTEISNFQFPISNEFSNSNDSNTDAEAPKITIQGNNPAILDVGARYADLGAVVTDDKNDNLGYSIFVDGILTRVVEIDTSRAGTSTIEYVARDQEGNTATATRIVIVGGQDEEEVLVSVSEENSDDAVSSDILDSHDSNNETTNEEPIVETEEELPSVNEEIIVETPEDAVEESVSTEENQENPVTQEEATEPVEVSVDGDGVEETTETEEVVGEENDESLDVVGEENGTEETTG